MRSIVKKILGPLLKGWYKFYSSKAHSHARDGVQITVYPNVFNPGLFLSTNLFINYFLENDLKNKTTLELGAGSGFISFYLEKKLDCSPTASDINSFALEGLKKNKEQLNSSMSIVESNLFDNLNPNDFEYIIINPPYYPKSPKTEAEHAFFCGDDFEYFRKLFLQLNELWKKENSILMILSEDCDLEKIKAIALENEISFELVWEGKKRQEVNYIFKIN